MVPLASGGQAPQVIEVWTLAWTTLAWTTLAWSAVLVVWAEQAVAAAAARATALIRLM